MPENAGKDNKRFNYRDHAIVILPGDVKVLASVETRPSRQCFHESLNGKFRAECLNANWFLSLDEARRKCEAWRRDYNEVRPHSAIGNQVPAMLHRSAANPGQAALR